MRKECRYCGNQVATGMLRCPFCGIRNPHAPGGAPPPKRPELPDPATLLVPTPADPDPAAETEPFAPDPPRERVHGLRGRMVMTVLWMVGAFLSIKGCASWGTPDSTSAGMDTIIMATGIGLIWTASAIRGWRRLGMQVALGLITLIAGVLLVDFIPFLSGHAGPVRWGPSLWTIGVAALFGQYFLARGRLFGKTDPLLDVPAPVPFREQTYVKAGGGRTARQAARMNAAIAINNAISREKSPRGVAIETVRAIPREFGHSLESLDAERKALYRAYLQRYLGNGRVSRGEREELVRLADLLELDEAAVDGVERAVGRQFYRWRARRALEDGRITVDEHAALSRIRAEMSVSDVEATAIEAEIAAKPGTMRLPRGPLLPAELEELRDLAVQAGAPSPGSGTRRQLERMRLRERVFTHALPVEDDDASSHSRGEVCHAARDVESFHLMAPDSGMPDGCHPWPARPEVEAKLWLGPEPDARRGLPEDDVRPIARGRLTLTSRRLVLSNEAGSDALDLRDVTHLTPFANGLELRMRNGVALFMAFRDRVDELALLTARAIALGAGADAAKEARSAGRDGPAPEREERMVPDAGTALPAADETPPIVGDARKRDSQSQA